MTDILRYFGIFEGYFGQCEGLTGLSLGYNRNVGALGCKALAAARPKCGELQFLCLNGNHEIGDEGAAALSYALSVW